MAKIVWYTGRTNSRFNSSSPAKLVIGKEYKLIREIVWALDTQYVLVGGVEVIFNFSWVDEISVQDVYSIRVV